MTPLETLKRLAELQKDATKGPWHHSSRELLDKEYMPMLDGGGCIGCSSTATFDKYEDVVFCAQSGSTDFAAIAAYVAQLEKIRDEAVLLSQSIMEKQKP